ASHTLGHPLALPQHSPHPAIAVWLLLTARRQDGTMGKDGQKVHGRAPSSVLPDIDNEQPTLASAASGGGGFRTYPPIPPATYASASGVGSDAATAAPSSASAP